MTRIFTLLLALALAGTHALPALAEGGGREFVSPFVLDDPEAPDHEREGDPEFRSMLQRGYDGEFGKIAIMVASDLDFAVAMSGGLAVFVQGFGGQAPKSKNPLKLFSGIFKSKSKVKLRLRYGSIYHYQEDLYIFPDASELAPGDFDIDLKRKFFITEIYDDEVPTTLALPAGSFTPAPITNEARLTYKSVIDEGTKFGDVYYDDNRLTFRAELKITVGF